MARIIKTLIQKRVSDIDMFQHVNNVSQQMYFDLGKADFYRQVLQDDDGGGGGVTYPCRNLCFW